MTAFERINTFHNWMREIRHDLHAHPEIGFEEKRTAALVADALRSFGIAVYEGVGQTGVIGVLQQGTSSRSIGLRADMDALPMAEENSHLSYRSRVPNRMHACGHDGHTAMLLGTARYLARRETLMEPSYLSSSLRKKASEVRRRCWRMGCSTGSRAT
ncbi:MAG: M20/M25/M40 family metallo-hydrolase [Gluconobacter cerinus]|uniref:M20/M25/M40 family metallo-hydrolase n=1 Tax=Gluconobacter cerinus TaxID=38307 RepID=UPI0039ECA58A